jgi:hypothetical protein
MSDSSNRDRERLKQTLLENGESPEEVESLSQVVNFLRRLSAPEARTAHQRALLVAFLPQLPQRKSRWQRWKESYAISLLYSQVRVIHHEIWSASAFIMVLGVLVTLVSPVGNLSVFPALAPIVAAFGVAMLYDADIKQMLEIEETTLASARLLMLARLTLVSGFDLLLALAGSAVLAMLRVEVSLLPLILSWLAPMAFLSALAFFLSILLVDTLGAAAVSLLLWIIHLLLRNTPAESWLYWLSLPGLADPSNRLFLTATAGVLVVVAIWFVGHQERGAIHRDIS